MREYNFIDDNGNRVPVSQLSTALIHELLSDDVDIVASDGFTDPVEAVHKRLRLELDIRRLGLR